MGRCARPRVLDSSDGRKRKASETVEVAGEAAAHEAHAEAAAGAADEAAASSSGATRGGGTAVRGKGTKQVEIELKSLQLEHSKVSRTSTALGRFALRLAWL